MIIITRTSLAQKASQRGPGNGLIVMVSNCVSQTQNASQPKPTTRYYEYQCTCHNKQSSITDGEKKIKLHNQDFKIILVLFVENGINIIVVSRPSHRKLHD